jgi:hypothetical protein
LFYFEGALSNRPNDDSGFDIFEESSERTSRFNLKKNILFDISLNWFILSSRGLYSPKHTAKY